MEYNDWTFKPPDNEFGVFAYHTSDNKPIDDASWPGIFRVLKAVQPALAEDRATPTVIDDTNEIEGVEIEIPKEFKGQ